MRRNSFVVAVLAVATCTAISAPAHAITLNDGNWTWELAEDAAVEMVLSTDAVHPNLAGAGLHVQAWPSSGGLGFPRWGALSGSTQWTAPTDVSGTTGIPELGVPAGSGGSLVISGDVARWNLTISSRSFFVADLLEWRQIGDEFFAASNPTSAIGADLSTASARAWVADLGAPGWVIFIQDTLPNPRGLVLPDGPASPDLYGSSYTFTQRIVATAPCALDRSAVLQPLVDGDVEAPLTERAQRDLLRCAQLPDDVSLTSGESVTVPITIPASITSRGWLDDPGAIGMRVIGLPEGLTAHLIDEGVGGLAVQITGSAAPQNTELEVVLWREERSQDGVSRADPVTGVLELRVTPPQLAATGTPPIGGSIGVIAASLIVLGGVVLIVRRRAAIPWR